MPTEAQPEPQIYRMKLWSLDDTRAKSKFWYVRDKHPSPRRTRHAKNDTRESSEHEVRAMSARPRRCMAGCMRDPARAGEGLAARTPGDIFRHLANTRESVFAKRVLRVLR